MKFCPKCNNVYSIERFNEEQIEAIMNNKNDIPKQDKKTTKYYFKCTNCENIEQIDTGTLIISRAVVNSTTDYSGTRKFGDMVDDKTLPHTRNYVCPNKNCESHTNHKLRDAVFFKPGNSYAVKYVCTVCKTDFTP